MSGEDSYDRTSMFSIRDKIFVITGAAGALCGNMAEAVADLGAKVALFDIDDTNLEKRKGTIVDAGGVAESFHCDVLDEAEITARYDEVKALWGEPDVLVNGAGGNHPDGSTSTEFVEPDEIGTSDVTHIFDLSLDGFSKVFNLNFLGTFLPSKVISKGMATRGSGAIVNISSMTAINPLTKVGGYSAAKAAVANFTRWLAVHLSHTGVRVNAIAPGFFMTEQLRFLHIDQETGELTPRAQAAVRHTPMGRYGEPEELVGTVVWLCSEASRFVTGILVPIDGGFSSYTV